MGGAVCNADCLLEEDHQQCGAQTHTYTFIQYVGLSVHQAERGLVVEVIHQPVSVVPH